MGSSAAFAQATRTWVSGVGDDANPCSRTAPCKTFAGAISKTANGGEINVIDPGGFGAVTITKSITIDGLGSMASILASGTNGIVINAAATDIVIIRNLEINGAGTGVAGDYATGLSGIKFIAGAALHVDNVNIYGFSKGIDFQPTGYAEFFVNNSSISRNFRSSVANSGGIIVVPGVSGGAYGVLTNTHVERNGLGVRVEARGHIDARNSTFVDNTSSGVSVFSGGTLAQVILHDCNISLNGVTMSDAGVKSEGVGAVARIANNTITENSNGLLSVSTGKIISFGSNLIEGNIVNGSPTQTIVTH
jgi:hypothetical protein